MIDNQQQRAEEIGKYLSGNMTAAEREALEQWIDASEENRAFYEEMNSVWQITQPITSDSDFDIAAQWSVLSDSIGLEKKPGAKLRVLYRVVAAAAAVALLIFLIRPNFNNYGSESNQPVLVSAEESSGTRTIDLPDGSMVWLREGSAISYDRNFEKRDIKLTGEAFFDVAKDPERPFTVSTSNSRIQVLGTRFNVRELQDGDVELYVEEGKVSFAPSAEVAEVEPELVTRDQVAVMRLAEKEVEMLEVPMANITSWRSGILRFKGQPMDEVFEDLSRYYGVNFELADSSLMSCTLIADFEDASIDEVVQTIEFSLSWQLQQKNDVFYVTGTSCTTNQE